MHSTSNTNTNIEIVTIDPQIDKELYLEEKNIRLEILLLPTGRTEWWGRDHISKHILALHAASDSSNNNNVGHTVVGCVLLVVGDEENNKTKTAVLCQMAVSESFRSKGIGKSLISKCEHLAKEQGLERIRLNARVTAASFYEKCGYEKEGLEFEEVGLAHIGMVKTLL